MNDKNTGGPAFPQTGATIDGDGTPIPQVSGMTLRDHFAGQALQGILASPRAPASSGAMVTNDELAVLAYRCADAMLRQREVS